MCIPQPPQIQQSLMDYLCQHADVQADFDPTTDLIGNGILDSLLVTDLILFMQSVYGIELTARDISPAHFSSVQRMAAFVHGKLAKVNRAA